MINTNEQIEKKLIQCIIDTNKVILRKLKVNNKIEISDATIRSLFNGYLNKYFNIHHIDFKRLMKLIDCHKSNNLLFHVSTREDLLGSIYFKNRVEIVNILNILPTIKISEFDYDTDSTTETLQLTSINFKELELITF